MFFVLVFFATIITQAINVISIKYFSVNPSFKTSMIISLCCSPLILLANSLYIYYYGLGYKFYSFPLLSMSAYGIGLLSSMFIHFFIFKNKNLIFVDYISIFLIASGISLFVFRSYFK